MKYYVSSGNMKVVVSAEHLHSPLDAAREVCLTHYGSDTKAESIIRVNETGFEPKDTDIKFDTEYVLKEAGFTYE